MNHLNGPYLETKTKHFENDIVLYFIEQNTAGNIMVKKDSSLHVLLFLLPVPNILTVTPIFPPMGESPYSTEPMIWTKLL